MAKLFSPALPAELLNRIFGAFSRDDNGEIDIRCVCCSRLPGRLIRTTPCMLQRVYLRTLVVLPRQLR